MTAGGILLTFALVCISASVIIAVFFRFWPRYGSVEAAIEHSDQQLQALEPAPDAH